MAGINWQQFGLRKDPFDVLPLLEGGDIPIQEAFVGRTNERREIDNVIGSADRASICICGDVGVGKTTLANFEKLQWKTYLAEKSLFSSRGEIEANENTLSKKSFLLEIIGTTMREIRLVDPDLMQKDETLKKMSAIIDITHALEMSAGISGGLAGWQAGFQGSKGEGIVQPVQLSDAILQGYFRDLVNFIKTREIAGQKHAGLIVHMNNFDVITSMEGGFKRAKNFFNEIRDLMQMSGVYYLFLGPKNLFREVIAPEPRVKAVFYQTPISVVPLTKTEIVEALHKRMETLKSPDVKEYIKPFEDVVVGALYDLYNGDLRSILGALRDVLSQLGDRLARPLTADEAVFLLGTERRHRLIGKLTDEQKRVLDYIIGLNRAVTQKEVGNYFNKSAGNVSGYYFGQLKDLGVIMEVEQQGKKKFWSITSEYACLRSLPEAEKRLQEKAREIKGAADQMSLFRT